MGPTPQVVSDDHVTSDGRGYASLLAGVCPKFTCCTFVVGGLVTLCAWLGIPADGQDLVLAPFVQCFQKQMGRIKTLAVACLCLGGHLDAPALADPRHNYDSPT